jgi:hypothetical protein
LSGKIEAVKKAKQNLSKAKDAYSEYKQSAYYLPMIDRPYYHPIHINYLLHH